MHFFKKYGKIRVCGLNLNKTKILEKIWTKQKFVRLNLFCQIFVSSQILFR